MHQFGIIKKFLGTVDALCKHEDCLRCFRSTKDIAVIHLVPSVSKRGIFISSPNARLHVLELWHMGGRMILAHKRTRQLCVCFLSHTLCEKVKGVLARVRGADWLCFVFLGRNCTVPVEMK